MANPLNTLSLVGRIASDIKEFPNADGSKVLLITLAVDDNFRSGSDNKVQTNFVPVRAFIPKSVDGRGSWDRVGKGDLVAIAARIVAKPYMKDGETVYPPATIEADGYPQFLESKKVTEERAARKAVESTTDAPAAAAAAAPEETPEQQIARLQAEISASRLAAETSPFTNAAA